MANEFKIKKGLIVTGASGGTVVDIQGSQGQLFSVTDDLSGSIFAVSDISGVPILDVNSSGTVTIDGLLTGDDAMFSKRLTLNSPDYGQHLAMRRGIYGYDTLITGTRVDFSPTADTLSFKFLANLQSTGNVSGVAGTFTGNLAVGNASAAEIYLNRNSANYINASNSAGYLVFRTGGTTTALTLNATGAGTFGTQAFATTATSSGDASSTLTTKGYVDGLITGATIYRGAWDPSGGGYGSPDLSGVTQTSGYYYICSADGTAEPNGTGTEPDTWAVGDWVIYNDVSGTGQWQKIDNSSVLSGVGTGQTVALWEGAGSVTDSETLGNAPITVSGNNATFAGTITGQNIYGNQFVDRQDNAYYANPAGTSVMSGAGFDGDVTVTTQAIGDDSTLVATTEYADRAAAAVPIGDYVTLATAQTISGAKTFNNDVTLNNTYLLGVDKLEANKIIIGTDTSSILGDVGIGTTSPDAKLHVANEASFTSGQSSVEVVKLQRINTGGDIKATTEGHVSMYATDSNNDTEWARMSWVNDNSQDGGLETEGALSFWTSQAGTLNRAMYIDHDQNVGIGTTTPLAKLDIQGTQGQLFSVTDDLSGSIFAVADISGVPIFDVNSSGVSYFDSKVYINATASIPNRTEEFQVTGTQIITNTGTNSPALYLGYNSSGSNSVQLGRGRTADGSSYIDLNGEVMAAGDFGFRIRRRAGVNAITDLIQVGTGSLTINALNGADTVFTNTNVGIGTTSPTALLEVKKDNATIYDATSDSGQDDNTATVLVSNDNATANTFSQIAFHNKGSGRGISRIVSIGVASASTDLAFVTESSNTKAEKMRILANGNVCIGVTTTSYKLEVDGGSKISGNVIIGTHPNTAGNLTLKDATTTGSNSQSLYIWSQNSGRSFLSLVTAGTGEAQIGFGTSQYASQNTAGSIQYTTATNKFTFKTNYTLALTIANNQAATFTSTVTATNFILSSDKTLKNNIKEIDTSHIDVNWKNFELKSEPGVKRAGVIAQELEEKHPEFVRTDDEGMKSVAYIDLLIAKIAELEARLEKAGI